MKYLLLALLVYADGETSGMMPTSWFDDEASCIVRGEEFQRFALQDQAVVKEVESAHFDCMGLEPLDVIIMGEAMPYRLPWLPN